MTDDWSESRRMPRVPDLAKIELTPTPARYRRVLDAYPLFEVTLAPHMGTPWDEMNGTPDQWQGYDNPPVLLVASGPHVARDMADVLSWAAKNLREMADRVLDGDTT